MFSAERITSLRKSKGFSQEVLAEQSGVSLRTIQRVEQGETMPRGHTVQALAAALSLGPLALPLGTVTYMEGTSWTQNLLMRFSGMGGMLGNEPFTRHTVILDVRGGRFGLVR